MTGSYRTIVLCLLILVSRTLYSQSASLDPALGISTIPLYDTPAAAKPKTTDSAEPTLTIFESQPGSANGSAVLILPGGAYIGLASNLEGRQVADWFAARGFTAFVLKYRVGPSNVFPAPLDDAQRAIRLIRSLSRRYAFVTDRVGVVGFSAGGHLAALTATLGHERPTNPSDPVERESDRPDFAILAYPWLNAMENQIAKEITYCSVVSGVTAAQCQDFSEKYSPWRHITARTPPTFVFATTDDEVVSIDSVVDFYRTMLHAKVPIELHLFVHGAHGAGLGNGDPALDLWTILLEQWLRDNELLPPRSNFP